MKIKIHVLIDAMQRTITELAKQPANQEVNIGGDDDDIEAAIAHYASILAFLHTQPSDVDILLDTELEPVPLWDWLLRWNWEKTARGLVLDLLKRCAELGNEAQAGALNDIQHETHAAYREATMTILSDDDGSRLRSWVKNYWQYRGSLEHAWNANSLGQDIAGLVLQAWSQEKAKQRQRRREAGLEPEEPKLDLGADDPNPEDPGPEPTA
jgi:hypothetical protein